MIGKVELDAFILFIKVLRFSPLTYISGDDILLLHAKTKQTQPLKFSNHEDVAQPVTDNLNSPLTSGICQAFLSRMMFVAYLWLVT